MLDLFALIVLIVLLLSTVAVIVFLAAHPGRIAKSRNHPWMKAVKLYARMMEVFAGFCEHMDHHVGRMIGFLDQFGELGNTLIMFISDNGASSEGGPNGSINENNFFSTMYRTT